MILNLQVFKHITFLEKKLITKKESAFYIINNSFPSTPQLKKIPQGGLQE